MSERAKRPRPASRARPHGTATQEPPARDQTTPRSAMVLAAAALLGERGLAGTSFSGVIERSGAPRGSIYHHFPAGKEGLAAEAIALVGDRVLALFAHRDDETPRQLVLRVAAGWRAVLVSSGCKSGCPVAAVSIECLEHPELGARAAAVFVAWERALEDSLVAARLSRAEARAAAPLALAALQGALLLCRARREIAPLDAVSEGLAAFFDR